MVKNLETEMLGKMAEMNSIVTQKGKELTELEKKFKS